MFRFCILFFFAFLLTNPAEAQVAGSDLPEDQGTGASALRIGSYYSVIPIAGYGSDFGFYGGGVLQRINYGIGVTPFLSNMKFDATLSTKGNFITKLDYERTEIFGKNLRTRLDFIGQIEKQGHFFGVGNDTPFSDSDFDDRYYFYENRELYINHQLRKRIFHFGEYGKTDLYSNLVFWQVNPVILSEETALFENQPAGIDKGRLMKAGIGIITDSRDSEFSPARGGRYDLLLNVVPGFSFLDYAYSEIRVDLRNYFSLFPSFVFAHRFKAEKVMGTAPFWALPILGNEYNLRGYHLNRFRGTGSLLSMSEARSWLFSVWEGQIRFGMQVFWDTGRVFSDFDESGGVFKDWKHTFGVGGAFTLLNPDFIIRGDLGFSEETYRIYFGVGYTF
ncbi:MAG: hypothetical protein EA360_01665 [Balneolaceae bacterium]|nr:MAG: hypothetical protein EA360_01665 [Balneolaceae bacterium]